ncbi:MAG: helix-turn-helix transcriptional regulator [Clostridia bacterium]|nr:helix-turn-helix transcriptional regulator [Clostridia bacterium]
MNKGYTKLLYDDNSGFRLHHTKGRFAAESTTSYLHYDVELSLIYFIHGIGEIKIEGKKYTIEDNDLILLKPSELYHCNVKDGTYHERLVLYFSGDLFENFKESGKALLKAFYNRPDGFENKIPAKIVKENKIDIEIKELLNLVKDQSEVKKIVSVCKTVEILAKLRNVISSSSEEQSAQTSENPLINNVIAYINQNFSENISLEDISKRFYIDKYYISHLFKEQVGVTLWNYVIFRRLTAFNDLIRANTSIEEACFRVGFKNYSNFFRLYKKHMQMTPTKFKKSIRKD